MTGLRARERVSVATDVASSEQAAVNLLRHLGHQILVVLVAEPDLAHPLLDGPVDPPHQHLAQLPFDVGIPSQLVVADQEDQRLLADEQGVVLVSDLGALDEGAPGE